MTNIIAKYKSMPVTAKAGLWFTITAFLQRGIVFIAAPIFTRILTTEQYGIVSVYNTWEQVISILCTFNLFYGGFNNGMRDFKEYRDEYVSSIEGLITAISFTWLIIYIAGRSYFNSILEMETHIVLLMLLQIVASSAFNLWAARERFEYKYKRLVIISLLNTCCGLFIPIVSVLRTTPEHGGEARIIAQAISIIVICGCIYVYNLLRGKVFFSKVFWKTAFLFNLPLLPHYLSTMILNHSDRIMISKMVGNSEAALYSVAYSGAMILNILATSANQVFAPWIYGEIEKKSYKSIPKVSNVIFVGMALILMMLMAFAPEFLLLFGGPKYSDAVRIIPSVSASLYFILMYQIFANVEFYFQRNKFITYASMIGAILNIILNYIGIKIFGYIAPGYTTLICYIIFGVAHYIFMKKICREELDNVILFDSGFIFGVAVGLVGFSVIMIFLYPHIIVRYAILLVIAFISFYKREMIIQSIKILKK